MKKIFALSALLLMLVSGCSYERDDRPGEIKEISYSEALEKIKNKETFNLMISQTYCGHCQDLKMMLATYLDNHHVVIYDVLLDDTGMTTEDVQEDYPLFEGTPDLYVVEKGELKGHIAGGLTQDEFDTWVTDNRLDEKK